MRVAYRTVASAWVLLLLTNFSPDVSSSFAWQAKGTRVTSNAGPDMEPSLISDGERGAIAVWTTHVADGRTEFRAQRLDPSGRLLWGPKDIGVPVCTAKGTRFHPSVIPDGSGGMFLGWSDQRLWSQAHAHRIAASGAPAVGWPVNGLRVAPTGGTQFQVTIAADGEDGMYICWRDQRSSGIDIRLQRLTGSGEVATGWPADGLKVTSGTGFQEQPTMTPDGTGGVLMCWLDWRNERDECKGSRFACGGDIYAQRILANGTVSPGWPENGLPVCVVKGRQDFPVVLSDGEGGAIIGWRDYRTGLENADADVYAERVTSSARLAWGRGFGIPIAALQGSQWYPIAVSDGRKGAFLLWEDRRPEAESLFYLNHVDPGGNVWMNGGLPVRGEGVISVYSSGSLGADGVGGVYVAFSGYHWPSRDRKLLIQRFSSNGRPAPGWSDTPILVRESPGEKFIHARPQAARGGPIFADEDGVRFAWMDLMKPYYSGQPDYDVFVQRLTPMGTTPVSRVPPVLGIEPNPASRVATISFNLPMDGIGVLSIYDVHGRKRHSSSVSGLPQARVVRDIRVRGFPSGVYFVRVTDRAGWEQAQAKLVVVR